MKKKILIMLSIISTLTIFTSCTSNEYQSVLTLIEDKSYEDALSLLNNIPDDYKEAKELKNTCNNNIYYAKALNYYSNGDYQNALKYIEKVDSDFKDTNEVLNNINFKIRLCFK